MLEEVAEVALTEDEEMALVQECMSTLTESAKNALAIMQTSWLPYMPVSVVSGEGWTGTQLQKLSKKLFRDGEMSVARMQPLLKDLGYRHASPTLFVHLILPRIDLETISTCRDFPEDVLRFFYYTIVALPAETYFQDTVGRRATLETTQRDLDTSISELETVRRMQKELEEQDGIYQDASDDDDDDAFNEWLADGEGEDDDGVD